ncbi:MAG TPA: hypothetical protein VGF88_18930 [Acidobacteriaceae bacterium]|jgi:hypothetical protein
MNTLRHLFAISLAPFLLAGCSSSTSTSSSQPEKAATPVATAPEVITAKTAFWEMYKTAHAWSSDAEPIRVTAREVPGYKNEAGKAGMWEAIFGSSSLGMYRTFTYAIVDAPPNVSKGVSAGLALPWHGATRDAMPIDTSMFTIDSDAAYTAAAADAATWLRNNPGKEVSDFEIGDTYKFQAPVWYVMWGTKASGFATMVDASTGKVVSHK